MTEQSKPEKRPDKRERVTGRLRYALDLMIWGDETGKPLDWQNAARAVNISARSMRKSLERSAVRQYLQTQKQVLRACLSAKSLARLDEIAAQRSNMNAAVNAIRAIDDGDPEAFRPPGRDTPGVTIVIRERTEQPALPGAVIDITPKPAVYPAITQRDPQPIRRP
jgi:hypothetical protein